MARRNFLRPFLTAPLIAACVGVGLLTAPALPAGAAGADTAKAVRIEVGDDGFNYLDGNSANVGDVLLFHLVARTTVHTVTFDDTSTCPGDRGAEPCWPEQNFDEVNRNCSQPLPSGQTFLLSNDYRCVRVKTAGSVTFYDAGARAAGLDHHGQIDVAGVPTTTGPSTTSTTRPPTTTTTKPPTTTTTRPATTTTLPPTTATTAPGTIHPFLIDPGPATTTSTTAPRADAGAAGSNKGPGGTTTTGKGKDKGKAGPAGSKEPTPPATDPGQAPVFDEASLTPAAVALPDGSVPEAAPGDPLDAALANILHPDKPADDGTGLMMLALAAFGVILLGGGAWTWHHRSSRYFPA